MSEPEIPDAVMIPPGWSAGSGKFSQLTSIRDHARRILGVSGDGPDKAYCRTMPAGPFYCTRDPADTILFPHGHDLSGVPRYRWERRPDGSEHGFLVDEAREVTHATI